MKLIFAIPGITLEGGGPSRSVVALAEAMVKLNPDISLLTRPQHEEDVVVCDSLARLFWQNGQITDGEEKRALSDQQTVLNLNGLWLPFNHQLSRLATNRNIPVIWTPRGTLAPWAMKHKWLKKTIAWHLYQQKDLAVCQGFHATSEQEAAWIRNLGFKQPIAIIPNGVELPSEEESGDRSLEIGNSQNKQTTNFDILTPRSEASPKTALFLGRFHKVKGIPILLEAWARVRPEGWHLVLAGHDDDGHLPELERIIREKRLSDSVHIQGPSYGVEKTRLFQSADLFVLPSYTENFGIVVAEALSYGMPVLTTTGTPWKELETHQCGWWVDPTPEGIGAGLNQVLRTTNEELSAMGSRGRKLVEENYLWPAIAEKMFTFYKWVLHDGEKPEFIV